MVGTANLQTDGYQTLPAPNGASGLAGVMQQYPNIGLLYYLFESVVDSITAHSGGGQASATLLVSELSRITTAAATAPPYDSVKLPVSAAGMSIFLTNHGANPVQVFGSGTDQIDDVATATGVTQMANSMVLYLCHTAGNWYTEGLATGFVRGYSLLTQSVSNIAANSTGTQGSGTALTAMSNAVTSAGAAYSVTLPTSAPGMQIAVHSVTAVNTITVFPASGETINGGSTNAGLTFGALTSTTFYCNVAGNWYTLPRTPS